MKLLSPRILFFIPQSFKEWNSPRFTVLFSIITALIVLFTLSSLTAEFQVGPWPSTLSKYLNTITTRPRSFMKRLASHTRSSDSRLVSFFLLTPRVPGQPQPGSQLHLSAMCRRKVGWCCVFSGERILMMRSVGPWIYKILTSRWGVCDGRSQLIWDELLILNQ